MYMVHASSFVVVGFTHTLHSYFTGTGQSYDSPAPMKQPWRKWMNRQYQPTTNDYITTTKQSKTILP